MMTITFDEFKENLAEYVQRVREGESMRVEQSGETPVVLRQALSVDANRFEVRSLEEVVADPRPNRKDKYRRLEPLYEGNLSQKMLDLERGDR